MDEDLLEGGCLTAPGESGLSVFRVTGRTVPGLLRRIFRASESLRGNGDALSVGHLMDGDRVVDEVVVHLEAGGRAAEISTHGGGGTRKAVADLLDRAGVRRVSAERLSRPVGDPGQRVKEEARQGLAEAWSLQGMLFFLAALRGALPRAVDGIRAALEERPPPGSHAFRVLRERLVSIRARAPFGRAFSEPPGVALVGPPNSGKSTLANCLLGTERCIVTPEPGTTRDVVRAPVSVGGFPFRLMDSAGLRRTSNPVEAAGVGRSLDSAQAADIVLVVLDGRHGFDEADLPASLLRSLRTILLLNKADLGIALDPNSLIERYRRPVLIISAETGEGVADLKELMVFRSPFRGPAVRESVVPFSARQEQCLDEALAAMAHDPGRAAAKLQGFLEHDTSRSNSDAGARYEGAGA